MNNNYLEIASSNLSHFYYEEDTYRVIRDIFLYEMKQGLKNDTNKARCLKMLPTFVSKLPEGNQNGMYLALDLGGTHYRVILTSLKENNTQAITDRTYAIPKKLMTGTGEELFEYIANTLVNFLERYELLNEELFLGFTFSFPCEQKKLDEAYLIRWTKGFDVSGVQGKDVGKLLQDAINKKGVKIQVRAVINDTVGTLASCYLDNKKCRAGIIIGTGTNACYVEKVKNIQSIHPILDKLGLSMSDNMVINIEWGGLGDTGELNQYRSSYDKQLDRESLNPGSNVFEKMCSGMYLGELVRLICKDFCEKGILFQGNLPAFLQTKDAFHSKYITETERDPPHLYYSTHYLLADDLEVPQVEAMDNKIVRMVCEAVSTRAAYLFGSGIAALLYKMNETDVTIGIDGSLYKFHPKIREKMTGILDKIKPSGVNFRLKLSEDGSGKGAAAIASATKHLSTTQIVKNPVTEHKNPQALLIRI